VTFSQEPFQNAILRNNKIDTRETAYFRQRFKHAVFARLIDMFAERAERYGLTKAKMSTLTGKDPAVVNRLLSLPSNLTLDTLSDLALAMGCEPEISLEPVETPTRHNFIHEWMRPYANGPSPFHIVDAGDHYLKLKGTDAKPLAQAVP
jgi:hypothetical protein